jgi:hypothetical protein
VRISILYNITCPFLQILKHGLEKPDVVTVALRDLKNGPTDMKFTALDHHKKTISVNDTVKVLEGPLKVWHQFHIFLLCFFLFLKNVNLKRVCHARLEAIMQLLFAG